MIKLHDIETAITERLKSAGHTVTAAEVAEGFSKPTFFIDIFQNSATRENQFMELLNVGIELHYHPENETQEVLVKMADALHELLTTAPFAVCDCQTDNVRFLSVSEVVFDTEKSVLSAYFEFEFMRETAVALPEYEKMKNIEIGVKSSGTTANIN